MQAQNEFSSQNAALLEDMPRLHDARTQYFQPSLEALVKSQVASHTQYFQPSLEALVKSQVASHTQYFQPSRLR